jgi:hypothetical protein
MAVIAYEGEPGGLFDSERAECFTGNFSPTDLHGSGTAKEDLYLTDKGHWIKNRVVLIAPDTSVYVLITDDEAHAWLKEHDYPEAAKRYFERPRGGRPRIGEKLITTVPARVHNEIADLAEMYAEDMPDTVRRLIDEALAHRAAIGAPGSRPNL